jgi:hypothetical protein
MTGYKYTTEQDAQAAVALCDTHYGYPKSNCVTEHWCECIYSELDGFWYITYDESIDAVLGAPLTFDVTIPELN